LLTFVLGPGGSNGSSSTLGADETHYIYIDDSKVVTLGTNLLTETEFISSLTAPSWSESKHGWYSGSDRCIFAVLTDSSSNVREFFHDGGAEVFHADDAADLTATNLADATFTEVSLSIPAFSTKAQVFATSSATPGWQWETTDQVESTAHLLISTGDKDQVTTVMTNSAQKIGCKPNTGGAETLAIDTQSWFLPRGM